MHLDNATDQDADTSMQQSGIMDAETQLITPPSSPAQQGVDPPAKAAAQHSQPQEQEEGVPADQSPSQQEAAPPQRPARPAREIKGRRRRA